MRHTPRNVLAALLAPLTLLAPAWAGPGVFDLPRDRVERGVLWQAEASPQEPLGDSPMLLRLAGVSAVLEARDLRRLDSAVGARADGDDLAGAVPTIRIDLEGSTSDRTIEILRGDDADAFVRILPDGAGEATRAARLNWDRASEVLPTGAFLGPFSPEPAPDAGRVLELAHPLRPAPTWLDGAEYTRRFASGGRSSVAGATRALDDEVFYARLPRGYRATEPWGVLCWVDPSDDGRPPAFLSLAADELGLIVIGQAKSGNPRPVADRMQVVFDALETARTRYHIDDRRVYVTGISGGGRVASMLWACYPDVFTGAVPIVGLNIYKNVPAGPGKFYRASFRRPDPRRFAMLEPHRCVCITGAQDFNHDSIAGAVEILQRDGLDVRLDDYPDMGHQAPTPERFLDAMRWVDEPGMTARKADAASAEAMWDDYAEAYSAILPPQDGTARARLVAITREAPFTPAAWRAVELLRSEPRGPVLPE